VWARVAAAGRAGEDATHSSAEGLERRAAGAGARAARARARMPPAGGGSSGACLRAARVDPGMAAPLREVTCCSASQVVRTLDEEVKRKVEAGCAGRRSKHGAELLVGELRKRKVKLYYSIGLFG